jgi:hypothetical protein
MNSSIDRVDCVLKARIEVLTNLLQKITEIITFIESNGPINGEGRRYDTPF